MCLALTALLAALLVVGPAPAADLTDSLKKGTPDLKSAGPLTFGPQGILFAGDPLGAAIFAIDTGDTMPSSAAGGLNVDGIDGKIAALLGTDAKQIQVKDLAVNPASGKVYLSVTRGQGPTATAVLLRVDRTGKIDEFSLKDVKFSKAMLPNAPSPDAKGRGGLLRLDTITDLAYVDGRVFIAGLSNEEFASKLRAIPFPFTDADSGTSVEIFHGAHGRFETNAPVQTFAPYQINGESHLLAAYTCTPLVKFPVSQLKPGTKVMGTTVAELGNGNKPLDMVIYQKGGKDYVLLANSRRGVMKITTDNIAKIEGITKRIAGTAGLTYDTITELKGVEQLDKLDKDHALILVKTDAGAMNLQTIALP
jgi:hypothetical protein